MAPVDEEGKSLVWALLLMLSSGNLSRSELIRRP